MHVRSALASVTLNSNPNDAASTGKVRRVDGGVPQPATRAPPGGDHTVDHFANGLTRPLLTLGPPQPDATSPLVSVSAFVADLATRLAKDPAAARAVQDEAIARALMLTTKGDLKQAREVLLGAGDALVGAGYVNEANEVYGELARNPLAGARVNLAQAEFDRAGRVPRPGYALAVPTGPKGGTTVTLLPRSFETTTGELGTLKQSQVALRTKMETLLGRKVDPKNPSDAQEYFQSFARTHTNAQVAQEYQGYLQGFFKHSGDDVEWTRAIPQDERGRRVSELLAGQISDGAGRVIIDCEGFSYLTEHILGGLRDQRDEPRFNVLYATRQGHVITAVVAPGAKEVFVVNNDKVSDPWPVKTPQDVLNLVGRELMGQSDGIYGVSVKQSGSLPQGSAEHYAPPRVGALIWVDEKVAGTVTPEVADMYRRYSRTVGLGTEGYGAFLLWAKNQP